MPGAGSADVVVVDAEGKITIVECKLAKNPEMRRWVIGQLFEYAAALWKLDTENFERSLAARGTALTQPFKDPARWKEPTFRNTVSRNLADGAFRLVIAVDEITEKVETNGGVHQQPYAARGPVLGVRAAPRRGRGSPAPGAGVLWR